MSELSPTIAAEIVAACGAGAAAAADALSGALGGKIALGAAQPGVYAEAASAGFDGPGLAVLLTSGTAGLAIMLPESSGLLPAWYASPDAAGENKLATLAQQLSALLVPKTLAVDKFEARRVASMGESLTAASVAADAALVTLEATAADKSGTLSLVWPLANPVALFATSSMNANASATNKPRPTSFGQLPHYSRTLLKIRIPVSVHLATKKETVQEIVELVPGSIVKFEKGCDQLLQMVIGGQPVAEGEAVKIGDKFGFRVTSMLRPREHFVLARRPRAS